MLTKLLTAAALSLVAPAAPAQTAPTGQTVPATETPVKAVPQAGRQAKPQPVEDSRPVDGSPEAGQPGHFPGRQRVDRAAHRTHSPARGPGHGLGGHGRRH